MGEYGARQPTPPATACASANGDGCVNLGLADGTEKAAAGQTHWHKAGRGRTCFAPRGRAACAHARAASSAPSLRCGRVSADNIRREFSTLFAALADGAHPVGVDDHGAQRVECDALPRPRTEIDGAGSRIWGVCVCSCVRRGERKGDLGRVHRLRSWIGEGSGTSNGVGDTH